jgi:hypothetical protein
LAKAAVDIRAGLIVRGLNVGKGFDESAGKPVPETTRRRKVVGELTTHKLYDQGLLKVAPAAVPSRDRRLIGARRYESLKRWSALQKPVAGPKAIPAGPKLEPLWFSIINFGRSFAIPLDPFGGVHF